MRWTVPAALALHALPLLALLVRFTPSPLPPPDAAPTIEIEYVHRPATEKGAPPNPQPATAPAPAQPTPQAPDAPSPDAVSVPPPVAASAPALAPAPAQASPPVPAPAPPAVNLGSADDDQMALTVTGDNVVETAPDARYRNKPPEYPIDAARRHQQGEVGLVVHVAPTGAVENIDLVASSGVESLDHEAIEAVRKWHFTVPIKDGVPIASIFAQNFNFVGR